MMLKTYRIVFAFALLLLLSCSQKEQFPEITFKPVGGDEVKLNYSFDSDTIQPVFDKVAVAETQKKLDVLLTMKEYYAERDKRFDLSQFEHDWTEFNVYKHQMDEDQRMEWIEVTGYLLELTGDAKYAEVLEDFIYQPKNPVSAKTADLLKSYIYTKNVDHIRLNMFVNSTIEYEHSIDGAVKITQDNNYPESGKITIKFNVAEHPYVELFIRIPSWAKGATVSALSVKYTAPPGGYCQIARKWKDGDTVEIYLPVSQRNNF